MSYKISTAKVERAIHFTIIAIAGLSTVLRPSIESKITLFRVLIPFIFVWLFVVNTRRAMKLSLIISTFLVYSVVVSYLSRFETFSIPFNLYYITLFFFYFYYKEILRICSAEHIYSFLAQAYKIIIVLCIFQLIFGGIYPNTQDRLPAVNIFFWNENELSAVMAIFTPLFFLREKGPIKYLWMLAAVYLMAHNDAKLAILSLIVFFGGYAINKSRVFRVRYLGFALIGIIGVLALFFLREYTIQGVYTIEYFISRLWENLIAQEAFEHIGTFNARSNAVILGVKEFLNSFLLGIGPGNSLLMMSEIVIPGTEKYTALSMHNFTLQLVTEMGFYGLGILAVFFIKVRHSAIHGAWPTNLVFIFFVSALISITLLSGAWSNYFYLFILLYAVDFFKTKI